MSFYQVASLSGTFLCGINAAVAFKCSYLDSVMPSPGDGGSNPK